MAFNVLVVEPFPNHDARPATGAVINLKYATIAQTSMIIACTLGAPSRTS
jgi:hypothetical protein